MVVGGTYNFVYSSELRSCIEAARKEEDGVDEDGKKKKLGVKEMGRIIRKAFPLAQREKTGGAGIRSWCGIRRKKDKPVGVTDEDVPMPEALATHPDAQYGFEEV